MSKRVVGWALYGLVVVLLVVVFTDTALFEESPVEDFNRDWEDVTRDGKPFRQWKGAPPLQPGEIPPQPGTIPRQPIVTLEINRLDHLNRRLDCTLKISPYEGLTIRRANVHSWKWPKKRAHENGPTFDVSFVFPSEEEIVQRREGVVNQLERKFQLRVAGNPALYPFDAYRVEAQLFVLTVPSDATKPAGPALRPRSIDVTTRVEEFLPDFYMTSRAHALTFQEQVRTSATELNNTFSFVLVRHRFLQFFTVYIYTIALGFLIYISFSRSPRELLGGALGYFAALWGIRNVIAGKTDVFPTIVDYVSLLLYSILVLVVVGRLMHLYVAGRPLRNPDGADQR